MNEGVKKADDLQEKFLSFYLGFNHSCIESLGKVTHSCKKDISFEFNLTLIQKKKKRINIWL